MKKSLLVALLALSQACTAIAQTSTRSAAEEEAAQRSIDRFNATVGKKSQAESEAEAKNVQKFNSTYSKSTSADVQRIRETANEGAQRGRNTAATVDANGEIIPGSPESSQSGNPANAAPVAKSAATSESLKEQGRYLQTAMGVESVETLAQPLRGQGAGAATNVKGSVDLACGLPPGQVRSAKGVQVRFQGCTGSAGAVKMSVGVCVAPLFRPELCGTADFRDIQLTDGTYTAGPENVTFGLGCNTSRVCTVSFSASLSIHGTGAELQQQADDAHAKAVKNDNSMTKGLTDVYGSDEFAKQQNSLQGVDIIQVLDGAAEKGTNCTNTGVCLNKVVSEKRFKKTCDRSFLLTERAERTVLDKSKTITCRQERTNAAYGDENHIVKDSCQKESEYEWGLGGNSESENLREGMVEVGKKRISSCTAGGFCLTSTWDVYYADVSKYSRLTVGYDPIPLSKDNPICDERPQAKSNLCMDSENWFGRTLSDSQCTGTMDVDGEVTSFPMDYTQKEGCGICTDKTTLTTCYGQPTSEQPEDSCGGVNLTGCESAAVQPLTFSDDNEGLVTSQRETFNCVRKTEVCTQYESKNDKGEACALTDPNVQAVTFGVENVKKEQPDNAGYAQAAADVALAEEMASNLQDAGADDNQLLPLLFSGKARKCDFPTSSLLGAGKLLSKQCCRTSLERPKEGNIIQDGCDEKEVELAAARRQNYSHYIGEYCSKKAFFGKCLVKKQAHCIYNGLLPRLIAEQGREQLSELVASKAVPNTESATLRFDFYSASDTGSWTTPIEVNGVKLAAYQWPKFCADPAEVARRQTADPDVPDCPGVLNTWVAGCDAEDCGELPASPELGSMGWAVTNVDPLSKLTSATSKYSVIRGACDTTTAKCAYEAFAWPAGQGGKVIITKDMTFAIWDSSPQVENGGSAIGVKQTTTIMGQQQNVSDIFYRPFSYRGTPGALPQTVRVDFSTDGGTKVWTSVQVPTNISGEFAVPGTDLKISGACDASLNACRYRLVGTATVQPKGWGNSKDPDCEGFTAGQIAAMDFAKMDLSEWLNEVMEKNAGNGDLAARVAEAAKRQAAGANPSNGGQITPPSESQGVYAMATPPEGYGPFTVSLAASGWWPYSPTAGASSAEKVTSVMVTWGDCGVAESLPVVTSVNGQAAHGFRGTHRYKAPSDDSYKSCGVGKEASVDHKVELTVTTEAGRTYKSSLSIRNVWSNYEGVRNNVARPAPAQ